MSGTSADALDVALTEIQGTGRKTKVRLARFESVPFRDDVRAMLQERLFREDLPLREMMQLQRVLEHEWIEMLRQVFTRWNIAAAEIDLIGSHGQTLLHIPSGEGDLQHGAMSLQIVDGDALAAAFGVDVMSDFRQRPIAMGFEGAPLAPLAEEVLVPDSARPIVLLNLGGIANATLLMPADPEAIQSHSNDPHPDDPGSSNPHSNHTFHSTDPLQIPPASDLGPANTCIDSAMRIWFDGMHQDEGGKIARSGQTNPRLLQRFKSHPFFGLPLPVSTGPETFSSTWLQSCVGLEGNHIKPNDIVATVTHFSAWSVVHGLMRLAARAGKSLWSFREIRVSGGGVHNPVLMETIEQELELALVRERPDGEEAGSIEGTFARVGAGAKGGIHPNVSNSDAMKHDAAQPRIPRLTTGSLLGIPADAKEAVLFAILAHESRYGVGWRTDDGRILRPGKCSSG